MPAQTLVTVRVHIAVPWVRPAINVAAKLTVIFGTVLLQVVMYVHKEILNVSASLQVVIGTVLPQAVIHALKTILSVNALLRENIGTTMCVMTMRRILA